MSFFSEAPDVTDSVGKAVRDLGHLRYQRLLVEELWEQFRSYAEPHFLAEAGRQFHSRFWEMYLGVVLLCAGKRLRAAECRNQDAPDLCIDDSEFGRIWIEAVAPQRGDSCDAAPLARIDQAFYIDEEKIILRLTSALAAKLNRFSNYRALSAVKREEPCVIAINGWLVPNSDTHFNVPYIVKAVFPMGRRYVRLSIDSLEVLASGYEERRAIERANGARVRTDNFFNPDYSLVSGVLFSRASGPYIEPSIGADFLFVHNPRADNPLPPGWLQVGKEYWLDGDELKSRVWETKLKLAAVNPGVELGG